MTDLAFDPAVPERQYAGDPATPAMVRGDVLDTTLELRPG